jgi:TolB protein
MPDRSTATERPTVALRPRRRGSLVVSAIAVLTCALAASAAPAKVPAPARSTTTPGKNEPIVFRRYFNADQSWGAVFTVGADGKNVKQVTRPAPGVVDDQPSWAPDGKLITFYRCAPDVGGLCHAFVVAPDGSGLAPVGAECPEGAIEATCPADLHPSFSPDSKQIAIAQATGTVEQDAYGEAWIEHSAIALMNIDGSGRRVIYQLPGAFTGDLNYPVFSPDGKQLVFERARSGGASHVDKRAVFVIAVDGSHLRRLTPWAERDGDNPDWSPDGKWIVFRSHEDDPKHQSQIFLIHPDGTGRRQLTHFSSGTHVASSSFSPDGTSIAISKGPEGGNIDVFALRLDGTHMQRITHSTLWDSAPDWGPAS